jgi:hypothetical protein
VVGKECRRKGEGGELRWSWRKVGKERIYEINYISLSLNSHFLLVIA